MPDEPASLSLAADFPTPSKDEWLSLAAAVLKKAGVEDGDPVDALSYLTYDDIRIRPLYTAEDGHDVDADGLPGHPPFVRGSTEDGSAEQGWDVCVRHVGPDAKAANTAILADLETGATSLWLALGAGGVAIQDLASLLDGVYLDLAPITLDAGADTVTATAALLELSGDTKLTGSLGADPIGTRARTGSDADLTALATLAEQAKDHPELRIATVDGAVYHDAGASDAQELGIATSVGVAYLRALTDAGMSIDDAFAALDFRIVVTAEQFPSIAKLRAARRVWTRVAELCEATPVRGQRQHAVTSAAMLTRRDPWVNILRTTIACFAAAVGGADAITVLPFDAAIGVSDGFARRIARNTHAVLHDESSLARVIDAAGGSWFVESLTDELAEAAWTVFTDLEKNGGALARLDDGTMADVLAGTHARRAEDIAHRRAPITGVSEYAFVAEQPVRREPEPEATGEGLLPRLRYAQDFEALRDRCDAAAERPKVYLATLGSAAASSARAGFAVNLFSGAGLECVTGPVEHYDPKTSAVACLCSSDKVYADEAQLAAKTLREAGATRIWLAGKADVDGVDATIFAGCDALDVLRTTLTNLGVPE